MSVSFVIESWAACAPGLDTPERWSQWAAAPWLPEGEPQVALSAVPAMVRRRFAPLGRTAAQVVFDLAGSMPSPASQTAPVPTPVPVPAERAVAADLDDNPTVFASRYGETTRCLDLLADQARGQPLSPTAFGLSVHNAIGAMIAIVRADRRNSSAIAAGRATAAAGVTEAMALLEDGASSASLVVYDAPLPPAYAHFEDEPSAHFAWAWRLRRPRAGEWAFRLEWLAACDSSASSGSADADAVRDAVADEASAPPLPASLQALWFALSGAATLVQHEAGRRCRWSRDD